MPRIHKDRLKKAFRNNAQRRYRVQPDHSSIVLPDVGRVALLVIDVQPAYCDPRHPNKLGNSETVRIADRIRRLAGMFRRAGVRNYAVHFKKAARDNRKTRAAFFLYRPHRGDRIVGKDKASAFRGSPIHRLLKGDGKKSLLLCGFNLNGCVMQTAMDARAKGYDVQVLTDLSGNDSHNDRWHWNREAHEMMAEAGIGFLHSQTALRALKH